jgi:membrane-associated protein
VPMVKQNFGLVTIGIVVVSVLPVVWGLLKKQQPESG